MRSPPRIRLLISPGTLHSRGADRMDFTRYSRSGKPRMTGDEPEEIQRCFEQY